MPIEHKNIADANLHEPKGVAAASADTVYVANGAGSGAWERVGRTVNGAYYYEDTTTAGTPIPLTVANTQYELTNDGAGPNSTSSFRVTDQTEIWNTSTNRIDISGLDVGDSFEVRLDAQFISSGVNHAVDIFIEFGVGGTPFQLPIVTQTNFKTAATWKLSRYIGFFIRDANMRDNPARLLARSDNTGDTIIVDDFYFNVLKRV